MRTFVKIALITIPALAAGIMAMFYRRKDKNYILTQTLNELSGYDY